MSSKGIYTALSGAMAQSARLDTIANNIANVNTTGFKKDQQVFREYLTAREKQPDVIQVPRIPASVESFYDMQGGDKSFVDTIGTFTKHEQGALKSTGGTLDFALEGRGFFEVSTPQGVKYTRGGPFHMDGSGLLVNKDGFPVLREGLQDPAQRTVNIGSRNITVSANGEIYSNGESVGKISVVDFANVDVLQKTGNSLYQVKPNMEPQLLVAGETQVKQGFLESSNVNIVEEMTDMITASRLFETSQQAMRAFDQMDDKLINQMGKP